MDEQKTNYSIQKEEIIKNIEIETFMDQPNTIKKISFITETKTITWKPKTEKIDKLYGMILKNKVPMGIEDIPETLKDLGTLLNRNGEVAVLCDYFSKSFEGKTYYFFMSVKTFAKWSICHDKIKEENEDKNPAL